MDYHSLLAVTRAASCLTRLTRLVVRANVKRGEPQVGMPLLLRACAGRAISAGTPELA